VAIDNDMQLIADLIDDLDQIPRLAHEKYREYPADILIEHTPRAAATCTYDHMVAEAERRWIDRRGIVPKEIRGLKVWIVRDAAVLRFKKMDEDGRSRNYPTKQAKNFDDGATLPGLPEPAARLSVGYLLDGTQSQFIRAQVAKPRSHKTIEWCAAIVPASAPGERTTWRDVTRQPGF